MTTNRLYLYKNNQQLKEIKPSMSNLHPDNLKDIDNRVEPMEQANQPTPPADRYPQDPTTDPDITQRQTTQNDYPGWVFQEYLLHRNNLWNKPWQDGKEHLVPKKQFLANVMGMHTEGENTIGKMIELALAPTNLGNTDILLSSYTAIFVGVDKDLVFPQMQAIARITQNALARRAFDKYAYLSAADRWDNSTQAKNGEPEPEYITNMQTRMIRASTIAGTWCRVHSECWHLLEWKNNPVYSPVMIQNEINLLAVNQAKWIEDNYGPVKAQQPNMTDKRALAAAC